jgi:hypothetical protein
MIVLSRMEPGEMSRVSRVADSIPKVRDLVNVIYWLAWCVRDK